MADDLGQAFLEGVFKTRQLQQNARQQQAEMQFRQMQLQAENQRASNALDAQKLYQQGLLANDQTRTDLTRQQYDRAAAGQALALQLQGAQVAQPTAAPTGPTLAPDGQNQGPAMGMSNPALRAPQGAPSDAAGLQLAPPGATEIGGQFLRIPTPQERAQTQNALVGQQIQQGQARLDQLKQSGMLNADAHKQLSALNTIHAVLGNADASTIQNILAPKPTALKEGDESIGDQGMADAVNKLTLQRLQVLNPKMQALPPEMVVSPKTTRNQLATIDKIMTGTESAKSTVAQQAQSNALRQAMVDVANGRLDVSRNKQAVTIYQPAVDSAERFNIMTENYEKAVKDHDQQAMLSLLSNHIGMTLGAQKGARITKDIIHEAKVSRPFLEGMETKFDENGILSGVTLSVPQMQRMVGLGQSRLMEDTNKAKNVAAFAGLDTDGPDRTPNAATINFYMSKTHGDKAAAKKLAASDGWTVK